MAKQRQTSAAEDGVALFKAIGLVVLAVALAAAGSLVGAFIGHWIPGVPFWAAAAVAVWKARGPLASESRLHDRQAAQPVAVLDTGAERDHCPCCRYPTIAEGDDTCLLCDWPLDPQGETDDPVSLREGRENFGRYFSIYDPERAPDWAMLSPDEAEVRKRLIAAYRRVGHGNRSAWFKARSLEEDLAVMRHRRVLDQPRWPELPPTE